MTGYRRPSTLDWLHPDRPVGYYNYAWWDNVGALIGFIAVATALTIYFFRQEDHKWKPIIAIAMMGCLVGTALGVKSLN